MSDLHDQVTAFVNASDGWTELSRCLEMVDLITEHKPEVVVEIGVFGGRTLIPQAMALKANGKGRIYGIDPWKLEPCLEGENEANRQWWSKVDLEEFQRRVINHIWRLELDQWATIIRSPSQYVSDLFAQWSIDILYIDGCHSEIASSRDVILWTPKVKPEGFIHFDDCLWPSVQPALKLMAERCEVVKDGGHYRLYKKLLR